MVRFPTVSRGNKEPDITEDGADSQRLENRSFLESTLVRSDNDRTVRNELFDSRGAIVSIIIVESNWTRGERPARPRLALHGITWHWHWHCSIPVCWCEIGAGPKPSLTDRLGSMPSASLPGVPAGMASAIATACICGLGLGLPGPGGAQRLGREQGGGGAEGRAGRKLPTIQPWLVATHRHPQPFLECAIAASSVS